MFNYSVVYSDWVAETPKAHVFPQNEHLTAQWQNFVIARDRAQPLLEAKNSLYMLREIKYFLRNMAELCSAVSRFLPPCPPTSLWYRSWERWEEVKS